MYISDKTDLTIKEGIPRIFKKGNLLVLLGQDERITLIEWISEMFNLEEEIDVEIINYWKQTLSDSFSKKYNSYRELKG